MLNNYFFKTNKLSLLFPLLSKHIQNNVFIPKKTYCIIIITVHDKQLKGISKCLIIWALVFNPSIALCVIFSNLQPIYTSLHLFAANIQVFRDWYRYGSSLEPSLINRGYCVSYTNITRVYSSMFICSTNHLLIFLIHQIIFKHTISFIRVQENVFGSILTNNER